jgi:hypothetical protein
MERQRFTKPEKEYLRAIINNLSLQNWTERNNGLPSYEKNMNMSRSTVTIIKNNIEKDAEMWYIELRDSKYKS